MIENKKNITNERELCVYLQNNKYIKEFNIALQFYNEIFDITTKAKDSNVLQIKLQWFIDALQQTSSEKTGHILLDNLKEILKAKIYTKFITIIEAKSIDTYSFPFTSLDEIIEYCGNTEGIFQEITAEIMNIKDEHSIKQLKKAGTAFAIMGLIRNINFHDSLNRYPLFFNEKELWGNKEKQETNNQKSNKESEENNDIKNRLFSLVDNAKHLIKESRMGHSKAKRLLLLNIFSEAYINNLESCNYNIGNLDSHNISFKYYCKLIIKYLIKKT